MSSPTVATIKRLFAVSGNRCAFPKCSIQLVDAPTGKVTGRISHIKGRHGGPRYDSQQTEEQRHGFENLLLLCPIHHDVIDDDPDSYTPGRLITMKAKHESAQVAIAEPSDAVANQFIASISSNTITHGSIIFSQNQMGGQIAHSIQNLGPQPRQLAQAAANALVADLRQHPVESIHVECNMGDTEGYQLATDLKHVLELAGWQVNGVLLQIYTAGPVKGVSIEAPATRPSLELLLKWLASIGLKPQGLLVPNSQAVRLIVGANL